MCHRGTGVSFDFGRVTEDAAVCASGWVRNLLCFVSGVQIVGGLAAPRKTGAQKNHDEKENQGNVSCCDGTLKSPSHAKGPTRLLFGTGDRAHPRLPKTGETSLFLRSLERYSRLKMQMQRKRREVANEKSLP